MRKNTPLADGKTQILCTADKIQWCCDVPHTLAWYAKTTDDLHACKGRSNLANIESIDKETCQRDFNDIVIRSKVRCVVTQGRGDSSN